MGSRGIFSRAIESAEPVDFQQWEEGLQAIRVRRDRATKAILARDGDNALARIARGETVPTGASETANAALAQVDRAFRRECADFAESKTPASEAEHRRLLTAVMAAEPALRQLRAFEHNMNVFRRNAGQPVRPTAVVADGALVDLMTDFCRRAERILNPPSEPRSASLPPLSEPTFADLM